MPEAERREVDKMLRGLAPKHQRQLSVSSSNALERFAVMEVRWSTLRPERAENVVSASVCVHIPYIQ